MFTPYAGASETAPRRVQTTARQKVENGDEKVIAAPPPLAKVLVPQRTCGPPGNGGKFQAPLAANVPEPAAASNANAVVAICVVLVPGAAVGAVGTPERAGEASGAYVANATVSKFRTNAVVAICVVFVPVEAVGAVGVPVSAGEFIGARPAVDTPVFCMFTPSQ